jgi:glycosyltransferase involved in cell wall biosynthesis
MSETPAAEQPGLSALVVARNEEAQLAHCLETLRFADEIVVVLDRSTDGSHAIAERYGAHVIEGAWPIEGPRRHAGIDACKGPWILEVDADERVPPALAQEIRETLAQKPARGVFLIPYDNHIGDRLVPFGWGAYNGVAATYRLFTKGDKIWGAARVHPPVTLTGARATLKHRMTHYVDRDLSDLFARLNRYTDHHAQDLFERGQIPSGWSTTRRIFSRFWKSFVARKGYRAGYHGLALGLFSALYPVFLYLKTRERAATKGKP